MPQRLTVSISFWPYREQRDVADKIDNTVNYSIVAEETGSTLTKSPFLIGRMSNH
jgi:dihydroneopterin aldolase